jgi:hypothetical protein
MMTRKTGDGEGLQDMTRKIGDGEGLKDRAAGPLPFPGNGDKI